MRIVLVRHGRPEPVSPTRISGPAIGDWVRAYDAVGIIRSHAPPLPVLELARAANYFVASDLRRARESAAWLANSRGVNIDADLREAALPESLGTPLTLPTGVWIVIARLAWFLNWSDARESVAAARARAARMAGRLTTLAAEHECVMAVGHGMFNRFVAAELRRRGWRGPTALPGGYWGAAAFTFTGGS